MKINIICIGKIKEKYLQDAIEEYSKRLKRFVELNILEEKEENLKIENEANIKIAKKEEAKRILKVIDKNKGYNIALSIDGKEYSTIDLYNKIKDLKNNGKAAINYIIGGSYGIDDSVYDIVDMKLSFSKLTFPHQLFRVILLEQIYRVCKIENNEPYHK